MRGSKSPKVVREVSSTDDTEDYEGITTLAASLTTQKEADVQDNRNSNQTIDKISVTGSTTIRISLQTAGIVLLSTILLTCCCTLFIRNKITKLFNKIRGKTRKGKFVPIVAADAEDVSRSYYVRKPRAKRKRAPSYELVHTATQNAVPVVVKEPEEPPPTGCYRCYKKKRKKSARRSRK
ncbi:uncharacterized protein LOC143368265 [Andrena cerasifolii]|uniref:uncharacterized protein LOC143368265 n=1 Tax=Andrena cerasifolii TaxID=2819439 RepID=UPI0040378E93